jgi:hypothetical protein
MNAPRIATTRLPHTDDALIGREGELSRLDTAWADSGQHILIIRGIGGEGKTSLVAEWAGQLSARDYEGASYFDWSFYSQGTRDQPGASSGPFIAAALAFFGGEEGAKLANSPASGRDKAVRLLEYIRAHRALLILDGLEPLQHPPGPLGGRLRDEDMAVLLRGLAQKNPGLCVVTTREPVTDLVRFQNSTAPELELERLSDATGAAVLQRLFEPTTRGVHQVRSAPAEREEIVRAVKGHALTLRLLGGYIHKFLRDVRRWREIDYSQADAAFVTNPNNPDARYGHAFKTIEAYERWLMGGGSSGARQLAVLRLLGLFDRPAVGTSLAALRAAPVIAGLTESLVGLTAEEWNGTLAELEECGLVSIPRADAAVAGSREPSLDAHPLLREYFARRVRDHPRWLWLCRGLRRLGFPQLRKHSKTWRAAHRRLYEYLCAHTEEGEQPTLEDLQPLYQAIAHGCQAGLQKRACDEVYIARILRGNEFYSTKKLGAFGSGLAAVACFFETLWSRVSPALIWKSDQAWMLNEAAFHLRGLGRLNEALDPMCANLKMRVERKEWHHAPSSAINLSELELALGGVVGAVERAEQSVIFADRSCDVAQRIKSRTSHANALHQAGRRAEAEALFRDAERMQAERLLAEFQPASRRLYSVQGFQYCDMLLAAPERAAWGVGDGARTKEELLAACQAVSQRADETLKWVTGKLGHLDEALDHLTLGRSALLEAILDHSDFGVARDELGAAVSGLRRAGHQDDLPRGLLTRAWLRALTGARTGPESAQADLDEAWEIAERGPMPLFLADIHLYRARLFAREVPYPWPEAPDGTPRGPKDDLAAARRLIEKHGYGRRKDELEDAIAASRDWPDAIRRPAPPVEAPAHSDLSGPSVAEPDHTPTPPSPPEVPVPEMIGQEIAALHDALLSAFDLDSFDQMLRVRLDKDLVTLVGRGALQTVTFNLIRVAVREGWALALIRAAREHVPGNPTLKRFCADHPHLDPDRNPRPPDPDPAQNKPQPAQAGSAPEALKVWRERLEFLRVEQAKAVSAAEKFNIRKEIQEAEENIRKYGGQP